MEEQYIKIPFNVLKHKELSASSKLIYGLISSLCNDTGQCFASNDYFIRNLGVSIPTISRGIIELQINNLITVSILDIDKNGEKKRRIIKLASNQNDEIPNQIDDKSNQNDEIPNQIDEHNSIYINKEIEKVDNFKKPTIDEIKNYCLERKNDIDAERFFNYYESKGWKIGKSSMKSWKAAIRTWEGNSKKYSLPYKQNNSNDNFNPYSKSEVISDERWNEILKANGYIGNKGED